MNKLKCDICGSSELVCDVLGPYKSDDVTRLCYGCAEVVNRFVSKLSDYADRLGIRAKKGLRKNIAKGRDKEDAGKIFWFVTSLVTACKRQITSKAFSVVTRIPASQIPTASKPIDNHGDGDRSSG